ncbi:MAG: F0F1 ATP synthase subunit delta [Thermoleophilia bacterium]|jgi:F-type H+-transporting ATPase subunit b|nr:F0F1 ATP synthase subunit delta [Thermoleophilia bacterium]
MQIDWLTVIAQIVNFLILVWLLHHFLYGPVTKAMERREKRIADRVQEARDAKEQAEEEKRTYRERRGALEEEKESILSEARETAQEKKKELIREARDDADARRREWLEQVETQEREFLRDLRQRVAREFFELARRTLRDMADEDLEARMARVFVRHLEELDEDDRRRLASAAEDAGGLTVQTSLDLSADEQDDLSRALVETLGADVDVAYRHEPSQPFGIELRAGSQTVDWTLDDYLDRLEHNVRDVLAERLHGDEEADEGEQAEEEEPEESGEAAEEAEPAGGSGEDGQSPEAAEDAGS